MISQTAQYALRAVVCLARDKDHPKTTEMLSEMTHVSPEYLSKVMQALVRGNIVVSKPGKAGGFSLKISPEVLDMQTIIDLIDDGFQEDLSPAMQSYGHPLRSLHQKIRQLRAMVRKECSSVKIVDLIEIQM